MLQYIYATETGISSGLIGHLDRQQALPFLPIENCSIHFCHCVFVVLCLKALKPSITVYKCLLFYIVLGTGQMAGVELDSVSGGLSEPELGEIRDISAQHFIRFDEQNPETTTDKTLVIKNTT